MPLFDCGLIRSQSRSVRARAERNQGARLMSPEGEHLLELVDAVDRARAAWLANKDWTQSRRFEAATQDAKSNLCAWLTVNRDIVESALLGKPGLREQAQHEAAARKYGTPARAA